MTSQLIAATAINLRMLPKRWGRALIACASIACVVLVLVAIMSVTETYKRLMVAGTYQSTVLVLKRGARLENSSSLDRSSVELITTYAKTQLPEGPVSPELMRTVRAKRPRYGDFVSIQMRGVTSDAIPLRRGFKIDQGRGFQEGRDEIIVGKAAQDQFSGLTLGSNIRLVDTDWRIVGVFEASGSAAESEVWTGLGDLQAVTHQEGVVNSIRLRVPADSARAAMQRNFDNNPITDDSVQGEAQYYDSSIRQFTDVIRKFGVPVLLILIWGALFVSLNTMYGSVIARGKELSTLRAVGFRAAPLVESLIIESIVLALIGGLIAVAVAESLLSGVHGNSNFLGNTQYAFAFVVSSKALLQGLGCAFLIGLAGGLLPALVLLRSAPGLGIRGA